MHYYIVGRQSCGNVHITGEEVEDSKNQVHMQMYASNLDKKDFFGKVRYGPVRYCILRGWIKGFNSTLTIP